MTRQTIDNMRGEIEFRRKLFEQQVGGMQILENEFDSEGIETVLRQRMETTAATMRSLASDGIQLSPYLEIGAERGQRCLVMENELGAHGAALDLSFDLLRSCEHYRNAFGMRRLPLRICGDAYRLPIRSNSLPFVFCYQTLHHFPDPAPIVREIHRVLVPGGAFFFAEEPYRKVLKLELYQIRAGVLEREERSAMRRLVDRVFAREIYSEEDFGVVENHAVQLSEWRAVFEPFPEKRVTLTFARGRTVDLYEPESRSDYLIAYLLGGSIGGLCRKAGGAGAAAESIESALGCPAAIAEGREEELGRNENAYISRDSGRSYPIIDGIAFLMAAETRSSLYPTLEHEG